MCDFYHVIVLGCSYFVYTEVIVANSSLTPQYGVEPRFFIVAHSSPRRSQSVCSFSNNCRWTLDRPSHVFRREQKSLAELFGNIVNTVLFQTLLPPLDTAALVTNDWPTIPRGFEWRWSFSCGGWPLESPVFADAFRKSLVDEFSELVLVPKETKASDVLDRDVPERRGTTMWTHLVLPEVWSEQYWAHKEKERAEKEEKKRQEQALKAEEARVRALEQKAVELEHAQARAAAQEREQAKMLQQMQAMQKQLADLQAAAAQPVVALPSIPHGDLLSAPTTTTSAPTTRTSATQPPLPRTERSSGDASFAGAETGATTTSCSSSGRWSWSTPCKGVADFLCVRRCRRRLQPHDHVV